MKAQALLAALAAGAALQAAAQVAPTVDYTDMWYNPSESGWGISIRQKPPAGGTVDALFAVWYTYDPRATDATSGGSRYVPLWFVMPGGTWVSPTSYQGALYVLTGTPYTQPLAAKAIEQVGTFRFDFSDAGHGTFTYVIAPPAGIPNTNPAFGLPALTGSKSISRQSF